LPLELQFEDSKNNEEGVEKPYYRLIAEVRPNLRYFWELKDIDEQLLQMIDAKIHDQE